MGLNNYYFIIQAVFLLLALGILQLFRTGCRDYLIGRIQLLILLAYSYCFIGKADWRFAVCVLVDTAIAYVTGLLLSSTRKYARLAAIVGCSLIMLVLAYFKYANFFIENISRLIGADVKTLGIILPIGISFYTFSAMSYVIDVYRDTCKAERNILDFGLYMVFFPKVIAGPIIRWVRFKPQIKEYRGIKKNALATGIQIFVFGLFKKAVLADHLGVFVDDVFRSPGAFNTWTVVLSAFSYSMQIYLDFSGYSDMAIGMAKIIGFDFDPNFNLPYVANGFSDFWSRWHISLSQWFREYLYYPLGGSRRGKVRTYANLLVVMLVSGLWHGAGWTFILWGLLHGIASCITRWLKEKSGKKHSCFSDIMGIMTTFIFTTLFWTIFRANNIHTLFIYWNALFTLHGGINQPYTWTFVSAVCIVIATLIAGIKAKGNRINGYYPIMDLSNVRSQIVFFTFCGLTILLGYYGNTAFIYGRF